MARKSAQVFTFQIVNVTSNILLNEVESFSEALKYEPFEHPENSESDVYVINHVIPNGRRKPIVNLAATYSWVDAGWVKEAGVETETKPSVEKPETERVQLEIFTDHNANTVTVSEVKSEEIDARFADMAAEMESNITVKVETVNAEASANRVSEIFSEESGIELNHVSEIAANVEEDSFELDLLPPQPETVTINGVIIGDVEKLEVKSVGLFNLPNIFEFNSTLATAKEACAVSKLDWTVQLKEVQLSETGVIVPKNIGQAVVRSDNKAILGMVGARYTPIQNIEVFDVLEALVKVGGQNGVKWNRAGELDGGQIVWAGVQLPSWSVANDEHETYILAAQSHDGSMSLKLVPTSIRVICQNTLRMALADNKSQQIKVRHSKNAAVNLEQARKTLGIVQQIQTQFQADAEMLIHAKMSDKQFTSFVDNVMRPATKEEAGTRLKNNRAELYAAFNSPENKGFEGTAYAALQAVTAIESHNSARDNESRFFNLTFNPLASQGQKARKFLLDYAQQPQTQQLQYVFSL